jgi:hypothetical protein
LATISTGREHVDTASRSRLKCTRCLFNSHAIFAGATLSLHGVIEIIDAIDRKMRLVNR